MAVPANRFDRGECLTMPYTPGADVLAGVVVVTEDLVGVVPANIDANALGDLQIIGPQGVWRLVKAIGSGTAIAKGVVVYWDDTNDVITSTPGAHKVIGKMYEAATTTQAYGLVTGVAQATP